MDKLLEKSNRIIQSVQYRYERHVIGKINWEWRMNGIIGARGTGKTTLLLQKLQQLRKEGHDVLYVRLDDLYFTDHGIYEVAEAFRKNGGEYLYMDEVHKYPGWSRELKNIYDSLPELKLVFSGSSIIELTKQDADLSRRAIHYTLYGLSFREYLEFNHKLKFTVRSLHEILSNHLTLSTEITRGIKILAYFSEYLRYGYYPIFKENINSYPERIQGIVNAVIDADLPACTNIEYSSGLKIKKLLGIISSIVPYTPNISKLSSEIGISRNSLLSYIHLLHQARLIFRLSAEANGMSILTKPDKIYLDNPNLLYCLSTADANEGNVRETFFANQFKVKHAVTSSKQTDFMIDNSYAFEIGGKNKNFTQLKGLTDSYIAVDGVETGFGNRIPLWLFGFLY